MIVKITKNNMVMDICNISEEEVSKLKNCIVLVKGISQFLDNPDIRYNMVNELSEDDYLYIILPDNITKEHLYVKNENSTINIKPERSNNSGDFKVDIIYKER